MNDLVLSGDKIEKIEGVLSGTLSYLFSEFTNASSFSAIVFKAKELGYTEPDPRDDLNGIDVGRKVTILGRLIGMRLDLSTLSVQNIVPEELRSISSVEEFMSRLPEFDAHFSKLKQQAAEQNCVLRYVGTVNVVNPAETGVKLKMFPKDHPLGSLEGSDNIISFTTKYFPNPLVIQGAGAGAAVTAFGMFSDVLKVVQSHAGPL